MAHRKDWIPRKNIDFKEFSNTFCTIAKKNQIAWILITANVKALLALQATYLKYYAVTAIAGSFTGLDTENTQKAKDLLVAAIRKMGIHEMKRNGNMTNENRSSVGVHNDTGTNTPSPVEETSPVIQSNNKGHLGLQMLYSPVGNKDSNALPKGQIAIIAKFGFYNIGESVPKENECSEIEIIGKSPAHVVFDAKYYGMLFVGYARYLNSCKKIGKVATTFYGGVV